MRPGLSRRAAKNPAQRCPLAAAQAKIAVAINEVRTVKVIFLFINGLENEVVNVVQFSCNQHIGKEPREHKL